MSTARRDLIDGTIDGLIQLLSSPSVYGFYPEMFYQVLFKLRTLIIIQVVKTCLNSLAFLLSLSVHV